jgi:hypothetical protein
MGFTRGVGLSTRRSMCLVQRRLCYCIDQIRMYNRTLQRTAPPDREKRCQSECGMLQTGELQRNR